ncbi:EAL domain-containing protein [Fulvimarina sp. 2208YS6-2-32]|uniref:EAL domain-containing protein n=1 Tax=Fulvimarina uroteuthidis TaxID=3098149 RepID=A0ABU5HX80_9HYPH|nr:EAL domain-containing protein [Fulvimarina sp. 2208YS6-2-32]MDY8107645.1 EAL domain-containing protein [Fulvimarina sp. 2208YS6-2-32]
MSVLFVGSSAVGDIVETEVASRADNFSDLLLTERGALDAFMTGISRASDTEALIRKVSNLSGIERFSLFDADGKEIYQSRSDRYGWLMRDRPGGMSTGDSLSDSIVARKGQWRVFVKNESTRPSVIKPLFRDGRRIGFLQVQADITADRSLYKSTLFKAFSLTGLILLVATGVPFLAFLFRRRKIVEADARIEFLANHDNLTQLLNRRRMQEETDRIMVTARATRERMAYIFVDLDELGEINASLGQANGDEVLKIVAKRISFACQKDDLVARIGPDDFAILKRRQSSTNDVRAFARRLANALGEPIEQCGEIIKPRISIGCAMAPTNGRSHTELVKHAELAHFRHKSSKQDDLVFFEAWMDEDSHRRRNVEAQVRHAIENDGFELYYQPLVDGSTHHVVGFEALVRLRDNENNLISPTEFIPVAEARGYIKRLGTWVIQEATSQAAAWPEDIFVSVNLSTVQFADGDLVGIVTKALERAGISGRRLELEVVESLVLDQSEAVLDQLRSLRELGITVSMDDFGTGYSSLSYLWRFPFDKLKIDQSFMFAMANGEKKVEQLVRTIVSMGHSMGMKVVTEGVETEDQVRMLRECGCDLIQGYFFGRPAPANEIAMETLTRFRAHTARADGPRQIETTPALEEVGRAGSGRRA